jgi:hypothetical protein
MDHDSIAYDLPGPSSHRIADVREAYAALARRGLEVMGKAIATDPAYMSNESGHFAWDVSLLIRAACMTWRATSESIHLEQAAAWSQHLLERTDEARGHKDWRGRSVPAWSSGGRYTAGTAVVGQIGGAPIRLQAVADKVIIERPGPTTAIVRAVRQGGRTWSSPLASLLPGESNYLPDVLAYRSASFSMLMRGLPAAVDLSSLTPGEYTLETQHASHLVHTGMIARALIDAGETLEAAGSALDTHATAPEVLFDAASRALLVHDDEIRTRAGQIWYITPEDFPTRRLGLDLPHNHVVDAATSFLILGRRRNDKGLRSIGASLTRRFLGEIEAFESGALRHPWFYYPVDSETFFGVSREEPIAERTIPAVPRGEDSSHATMRVRALTEWKAVNDNLVPDEALTSVALSFRRYFMASDKGISTLNWLPGDPEGAPYRGRTDTYAGAWGSLAPWDSSIKRRINSMAYRHPPTSIFGATVLSAAEILAMNSGVPTYASSGRSARG